MIANCAISSDAIVNDVMRIVAWLPRPDAGDPREPDGSRRRSLRWLLAAHLGAGRASPRTEGRTVYAVDDVHGRYDLLMALLDAIVEDLRGLSGRESPVLVMFGDYVDRGPRSADVLAALDRLTAQDRIELHLLKGNHEAAIPAYLEEPEAALGWLRVGGDATMRSYGVEPPDPAAPIEDHRQACNRLRDRIAASHLRLLERLKLTSTSAITSSSTPKCGPACRATGSIPRIYYGSTTVSSIATTISMGSSSTATPGPQPNRWCAVTASASIPARIGRAC